MRNYRTILICFVILSFLSSCSSKKEMDREEYLRYMNSKDCGLLVTKSLKGICYELKCIMPEQQCLRFNRNSIQSKEQFNQLLNEYKDKLSFIMVIKDDEGSSVVRSAVFDKETYGNILGYANTELQKDFSLEGFESQNICAMAHIESSNSVQPVLRLVLAFGSVSKMEHGFTVVYNDNIFNNGPIKFNFSESTISHLPVLNLQSI